jgi:UTP--glucose-1-phosphate uridylyltransferase
MNASHLIDHDEPFFVFFADDFFRSEVPRAVQLKEAYETTGQAVISLIEIDKKDADKYGMAALGAQYGERTFQVAELIEKPGRENAPSNFASVGGYLLTPGILPLLADLKPGKGGELTLADAINDLAQQGKVVGQFIDGIWHDTGDQLKYIQAIVDMALASDEYGEDFAKYLRNRL